MTLGELIDEAIRLKTGNKEFTIYYHDDGSIDAAWSVGIGNPSKHVLIGEVPAEIEAEGPTAFDALMNLVDALREKARIECAS